MIKKIAMLLTCVAVVSAVKAQEIQGTVKNQTRKQRFDRGLAFDDRTPIMPKGLWILGLNGSYSQHDNNDYNLLIVKDFKSKGHNLSLSPMVQYVFANNQSIGVRFQYKRSLFDLDSVFLDLGDLTDSDSTIGPYKYSNHTYMGYIIYRYYLPLGPSKRFLLFNEIQLGVGGGQQKELSGLHDDGVDYKNGTYQDSFDFKVGLMPGMIFFITNNVAVELAVNLLGYKYQNLKQTTNQTTEGGRKTSSISSKLDIFSVNFGITFYM